MNRKKPKRPPLKIAIYKNRGGSVSYRVKGSLMGQRIQKNFPTHAEAQEKLDALMSAAAQGESLPTRYAMTRFPDDAAMQEAELAHKRLTAKLPDASLMVAVQYYLDHHAVEITDIPATQAIEAFREARGLRKNRSNTLDQSDTILKQFIREASVVTTADFIRQKAEKWIYAPKISSRTQRDRYDLLVNFAKFLRENHHLGNWPLEGVRRPRSQPSGIVTYLKIEQCQRLLDSAAAHVHRGRRGALLPYIALCLFSGLRPDEARRMGAGRGGVITLANGVAHGFLTKTGTPRAVALQQPLLAILERCLAAGLDLGFWSRKAFEQVQVEAGIKVLKVEGVSEASTAWDNDILRHTYASHHFVLHGDMGFLVINMGNSEGVLRSSYLNRGVVRAEGEKFFQLEPTWEKVGPLGLVAAN